MDDNAYLKYFESSNIQDPDEDDLLHGVVHQGLITLLHKIPSQY